MSYELLDNAITIIQQIGPDQALIAKIDIEAAFTLIPLNSRSYHLAGFTWDSQYFYDKVLPFGTSTSCRTFEEFSTAIQWILPNHFNIPYLSHILNDYMFFGPANSGTCSLSLQKFMLLADDLNIPVKHDKTVHPTTRAEIHGITIDTSDWSMSLPPDKMAEARTRVEALIKRRKVTLRELQSVIGTFNFATKVVVPG